MRRNEGNARKEEKDKQEYRGDETAWFLAENEPKAGAGVAYGLQGAPAWPHSQSVGPSLTLHTATHIVRYSHR